ncbi:3-phosphoglycerate dehydrogenase [Lactobacillus ruminis]|jgi:D-3-phosphoglycerate dehydrogenase / 2-oxoglutarate reductase|uniref:3-phosphoglycerate dehydrogenase family protein n=1 Tax=Ligilactobacillus ruminis TaxID=1623 RepID=UPI00101EFA36|nr:3-phosphoglycerate dehydrogenase family protein [Ligilactobacillus ruminis]MBD9204860.1 3-phosphoglycerate dehydrogenase [Ligilactobacillus ruminis]MSB44253.1 3-phosphoglycerate dehydrogenase [Ligilactobacillus ruminis]MSB55137.1 3-phosphoglycerate dehydrogenase [Ligilactobacillus ruminis]MSB56586.1 3-phosphoglycerate dehydrogenase [Ligilactobacillus ruminis]MSB82144.1 3-phosphoglycerate dehydrogenase [Ligilactobacillus ruminis]
MTFDVKTYNVIAQEGIDVFPKDSYTVNQTEKPDALLIRSQDMHKTAFGTNVLAIARAGAGFNNIPLVKCTDQGTVVFNTPGSNANAVKELVVALLILAARPVIPAIQWARKMGGADVSLQTEKGKNHFDGTELQGKRIGVIGLGSVGSKVARAAYDLGMDVVGYDPYISVEHAWRLSNDIPRAESLDDVLNDSDYVTIHIPYTEQNRNLISAKELAKMKDGAVLLNYSRGGIVNDHDVCEALDSGKLRLFMTDFSSPEVLNHDKTVVTPHLGGTTEEAEVNGAKQAARTLRKYLETGNIVNSVNFPTVEMPFEAPLRLTLIHQNIPNMVGRITTILANREINIDNMINRSRDKIAYTVIDAAALSEEQVEELEKELMTIPEVIRVRALHNHA